MANLNDMHKEWKVDSLSFTLDILKSLQTEYGHKTLDNIIQGLEAKVKYLKETNNERRG